MVRMFGLAENGKKQGAGGKLFVWIERRQDYGYVAEELCEMV